MYSVERCALIIAPKKKLIDWTNYIFSGTDIPSLNPMQHDNSNIFLIPDFFNIEEALEWLEENYAYFFEKELWGWCTDESLWPPNRTWEMFQEWLHFSIHTCVYDVMEEGISKKKY